MNENVKKIIAGTFVVVAIYIMVKDADGTNSIVRGLAEGYADVVKSLQGNR